MAIQTIKATIQMRKGLEDDFDADQMTAGEWAVSTDKKYVRMCFAPGIVLRMATYEGFETDMEQIRDILRECQDIRMAVERFEELAEQHKNDAANSALLSESWAHGDTGVRAEEDMDNSKYWSQQSKSEADRAKEEADRASSIVGLDIDSELSETSVNPVQNKVITEALKNVDISAKSISFEEAANRENIESGEKIPVLFGKLKKWLSDLKSAAFYNVVNNLLATQAGVAVLDARQGKILNDKINNVKNSQTIIKKLWEGDLSLAQHTAKYNTSVSEFDFILFVGYAAVNYLTPVFELFDTVLINTAPDRLYRLGKVVNVFNAGITIRFEDSTRTIYVNTSYRYDIPNNKLDDYIGQYHIRLILGIKLA